jgi:hypothetical protein
MIKKLGLSALGTSTATAGGLYSYVYYNADDLKRDHSKVYRACVRTGRLGILGAKMLWIYKVS